MILRFFLKFLLTLVVSYVLLIFSLKLHSSVGSSYEAGVYRALMISIIDDGDLNIINNVSKKMSWIASETYNYPDMHDHGAPVLWAPFYYVAKQIGVLMKPINLYASNAKVDFEHVVLMILSLFFGLLGLKFFLFFVNEQLQISLPKIFLAAVVFSTGFFNFLIYQNDSADITLFCFAAILIYIYSKILKTANAFDFLLLGAMTAFGSVIKLSFPTLFAVLLFLYIKEILIPRKFRFFQIISFGIGYAFILILKNSNELLKFGFVNVLQGYDYAYKFEYLFNPLWHGRPFFGPGGTFVVLPILLLLAAIFLLLAAGLVLKKVRLTEDIALFLAITASFIAKIALDCLVLFDGFAGFGARHFLIDTGALIVMFGLIYKNRQLNKNFYLFTKVYLIVCLAITTIEYFWWLEKDAYPIAVFNVIYIQDFNIVLNQMVRMLRNIYKILVHFPYYLITYSGYLIFLSGVSILWMGFDFLLRSKNLQRIFGIFIVVLYLGTTAANRINNQKNVAAMTKMNLYQDVVIGRGPNIFLYDEVLSAAAFMMDVSKLEKNFEAYTYQKNFLMERLKKSKEEIAYDPIGFVAALERGELKEVGIENQDKPVSSILDYNAPVRFDLDSK